MRTPSRTVALRFAALLALAVSSTRIVSPVTFPITSGEITARMTPALPGGKVTLHLGPFGELTWNMHDGPINIDAMFLVGQDVSSAPGLGEVENLYVRFILRKLGWLIVTGALVGAVLVMGPRRRVIRAAALGGTSAVAIAVLLAGTSFLTFDEKALAAVRYRGPVQDAPRVLALIAEVQRDWEGVKRNIGDMVAGLERIHSQIVATDVPDPKQDGGVRLLIVSDLHNNPLGLVIARELIARFAVEGILDAGDFTDRGTRGEGELFARFADLGVPHVIVAGNHEDVDALERVRRIPNVTVLESKSTDTVDVAGVSVLGDSDPNAYFVDSDPRNERALREIPPLCERLADRLRNTRPAIVLVHNPELGECAARDAEEAGIPLVYVWGHVHRASYEERGSVVSVSPGTSGANGIKTGRAAPYGFALLEFDPAGENLRSICLFAFDTPTRLRQADCHLHHG